MKRGMLSKTVAVLSAVAAGLVSPEAQARHTSISVSTDGDRSVERCDQVHVRFGDREDPMPMARNENRLAMSRHSRIPLHIKLSRSDGMRIQRWDGDDYAVKVCLAAGAESVKAAQKRLSEISVSLEEGKEISLSGVVGHLTRIGYRRADLAIETGDLGRPNNARGGNRRTVERRKAERRKPQRADASGVLGDRRRGERRNSERRKKPTDRGER